MTFNSSWPSDGIWWHESKSPLVQVMACCLTAPSHYLNQCWLIISEVMWHSHDGQFHVTCSKYLSLIWVRKSLIKDIQWHFPWANELRDCYKILHIPREPCTMNPVYPPSNFDGRGGVIKIWCNVDDQKLNYKKINKFPSTLKYV